MVTKRANLYRRIVAHARGQRCDVLWSNQRLVTLKIDINVSVDTCHYLRETVGAGRVVRRRHDTFTAKTCNHRRYASIVGGHQYRMNTRHQARTSINVLHHRFAQYVGERFARQPRGSVARRNDDRHAISSFIDHDIRSELINGKWRERLHQIVHRFHLRQERLQFVERQCARPIAFGVRGVWMRFQE
ncbi:hypothetical protein D3C72_1580240 [compost metagenome]